MLAGFQPSVTLWLPMVDANGAPGLFKYSEGETNTIVRKLPSWQTLDLLPHAPDSCEANKNS